MKRAVVFGAGKMACGLVGHVLARSGFEVQFVARRPDVVHAINRHHGYRLSIHGRAEAETIRGCSAIRLQDTEQVVEAVASADLVFTAVGIDNLAAVTPVIGAGLFRRCQQHGAKPLNVIACENLPGTGAYLAHQVLSSAAPEAALCIERLGGFSAAVTRRVMTGGLPRAGELHFSVDSELGLVIDQVGLKGSVPELDGAMLTTDFAAFVMRKFFTINCAQAVAAYLGYRHGCKYIHEAVAHPAVAPVVVAALKEATAALKAKYPAQATDIEADATETLERLACSDAPDAIHRVAREPRRKLSPRERLVGPARLAERHGLSNQALVKGIAAALAYDAADDPQSVSMQRTIAAESVETVITEDCGLLPHAPLAQAVRHEWRRLVMASAPQPLDAGVTSKAISGTRGLLQERLQAMVFDLSRHYEPNLVRQALARVAEQHCGAELALERVA